MIVAWSSGTGAAGIIGSFCYAGLTALGIDPRNTLRLMLFVPVLEAFTFWILLNGPNDKAKNKKVRDIEVATVEVNCEPTVCALPKIEIKLSGLKAKLKCLPSLVTFIGPLVLVFIFEYICVSGLVSFSKVSLINT